MKSLFFGIALIVLIGVAGFFYKNAMEKHGEPDAVACTMEAKICPDGSAVGRTGPSCEFSPCLPPNAEDAEINLGYVVPAGYVANPDPIGADTSLRAVFDKPSLSPSVPHTIIVRRYPIGAGENATDVILAHTRFQPADMQAESMERFEPVIINGRTFQSVVIERFEAQVHSAYFLARSTDVLMFEVIERDVTSWMDPNLVVANLPEHQALLTMLSTIQSP